VGVEEEVEVEVEEALLLFFPRGACSFICQGNSIDQKKTKGPFRSLSQAVICY